MNQKQALERAPMPNPVEQSLLQRCRESGRRAAEAGITAKDCPLAKGSSARRAWLKGHRECRQKKGG